MARSRVSPRWPVRSATAAAPEIGIGMLGYAFMGKAHSNAFKKIPYMMYPPVGDPEAGRHLRARRGGGRRGGAALRLRGVLHRLAQDAGGQADPAVRQRRPERRARRAVHRGGQGGQARVLREAPGAQRGRGETHAGRRGEGRGQAPGGLQLPLRPGGSPGLRADPERQAGPPLPLPGLLPAGMDHAALQHAHDLADGQEALPAAARWATWARTSWTSGAS